MVLGDATPAASMSKILTRKMKISVNCAGTYYKHDAKLFKKQVQGFCDEISITDNHIQGHQWKNSPERKDVTKESCQLFPGD